MEILLTKNMVISECCADHTVYEDCIFLEIDIGVLGAISGAEL